MSLLTAKDLHWFQVANAGQFTGKQEFYQFKRRFLRRFGRPDGFDRQTIEQECWTCDGSGLYLNNEQCRKCSGSGVHRTDENWLQRWDLHGRIFHTPEDPLLHWRRHQELRGEIEGRIQHPAVDGQAAYRCWLRLMLRHEPVTFWNHVTKRIKDKVYWCRVALVWKLVRLRNKLELFPPIPSDDVPF